MIKVGGHVWYVLFDIPSPCSTVVEIDGARRTLTTIRAEEVKWPPKRRWVFHSDGNEKWYSGPALLVSDEKLIKVHPDYKHPDKGA